VVPNSYMPDYFISSDQAAADLLSAAAYRAERITSADGHAEAMRAVIPYYLAKGDVDLSAELANTIEDPFARDRMLIEVADKCAEVDDAEYAMQLAEAIEESAMQLQAYERIALQRATKGEYDAAFLIAERIEHPDYVFAGIAIRKAAAGDETGAAEAIKDIGYANARVFAHQSIASAYIVGEKSEKGASELEEAVVAALEIEHDEEKLRALTDIGSLFIEAGRNDRAIETFELARTSAEALDNIHRDFFLGSSAIGFLHAGSQELADRTLDLVTDKTQMASCLLAMARDAWKKDEKDDALEALDEAYAILKSQRDIETRDSRARFGLLTSIAVQFVVFGKTDIGMEAAQEIADETERMSALSQIARVLCIKGEDELADQAVRAIDEDAERLFALVAMSDVKQKAGESSDAQRLLDEAAGLAETVPQPAARSSILNEIATRYIGQGQTQRARELSLANLDIIADIRDESTQAAALAALADMYATAGFDLNDDERSILLRMIRRN
jgi:hypothetical protein